MKIYDNRHVIFFIEKKSRLLRNDVPYFNQLIVKKRPGTMAIINVCKNEEKLLERLDQPILDVINSPEKTQQTTAIGTLF